MTNPCGIFNTSYEKDTAIVRTKTQWSLLVAFLIFLFSIPTFVPAPILSVMNFTLITLMAVLGLNIVTGCCGQISLGQSAMVAVGAYSTAILGGRFGLPFWLIIPIAGIFAALIGIVVGLPSLRIKGLYLVMATIAFQLLIPWIITHTPKLTGGHLGIAVPYASLGGIVFKSEISNYYLITVIVILMAFFSVSLLRTKTGRAFIAVRDNDLAAEILGINLARYKLLAFAIGSFYGGIGGSCWAYYLRHIAPEQFSFNDSLWYLGMVVVGGMGNTLGAVLGTFFIKGLQELVSRVVAMLSIAFPAVEAAIFFSVWPLVFGLVVMLFIIFEPRGLVHRWQLLKNFFRLWPYSY